MNILIVDDAMFLRKILSDMLNRNGFHVVGQAVDGQDAIEKYQLLKPDLVTMDITMPKVNGLDALEIILASDPEAKIIMCSAMGRKDFQKLAQEKGAIDFITKPFNEKRIIEILNQYK